MGHADGEGFRSTEYHTKSWEDTQRGGMERRKREGVLYRRARQRGRGFKAWWALADPLSVNQEKSLCGTGGG